MIKGAGGLTTAFLSPPNMIASSDWSNTLWVDDLALGYNALTISHGGWPLQYHEPTRRVSLHGWEYHEAWIYQWVPSPILQNIPLLDHDVLGMNITPDSEWLYVFCKENTRWWNLETDVARTVKSEKSLGEHLSFRSQIGCTDVFSFINGILHKHTFFPSTEHGPFVQGGEATGVDLQKMPSLHVEKYPDGSSVPPCQALPLGQSNTPNRFEGLDISSDGRMVAIAGYGPVGVWRDGKIWRRFQVNESPMFGDGVRLKISPDNKWLALGSFHAGGVWIWDLEGENGLAKLIHEEKFASAARPTFSPNGKWLGLAGDTDYRVVSTDDWKVIKTWPRKKLHEGDTCFSYDNEILAYQKTRYDITLVRTDTWEELLTLQSPTLIAIAAFKFSHDGRWLAAYSGDQGGVLLWDLHALQRELTKLEVGW